MKPSRAERDRIMSTATFTTTLEGQDPIETTEVIPDGPTQALSMDLPTVTTERTDAGQDPYSYSVTGATIQKS